MSTRPLSGLPLAAAVWFDLDGALLDRAPVMLAMVNPMQPACASAALSLAPSSMPMGCVMRKRC